MTDLSEYGSPAYQTAIKAHNEACAAYDAVLVEYRAGRMDDQTFLNHRAAKTAADADFDVAYAIEADWS